MHSRETRDQIDLRPAGVAEVFAGRGDSVAETANELIPDRDRLRDPDREAATGTGERPGAELGHPARGPQLDSTGDPALALVALGIRDRAWIEVKAHRLIMARAMAA
jgi:hypothetical protein